MALTHYYVVDLDTQGKVYGPHGRKKCQRWILNKADKKQYIVVKDFATKLSDWDEGNILIDEQALNLLTHFAEKKTRAASARRPKGTRKPTAAGKKALKTVPETNYLYRTGHFENQADVVELMKKLDVTDYSVQKDAKKGYYGLYNDPIES